MNDEKNFRDYWSTLMANAGNDFESSESSDSSDKGGGVGPETLKFR